MAEEIEIIIDKDGKVTMEGHGFQGKSCHVIMEELARKIGKKVIDRKKAEFYQKKVTVGQQNKISS